MFYQLDEEGSSISGHGRMMRMKIDIDDFQQNFQRRRKTFCISLSDRPFFSISWFQIMFLLLIISDVIWVTIYSWVMTVNTGGPLLCFLSSLKSTVPDQCGCFCGWLSPQFTNSPPASWLKQIRGTMWLWKVKLRMEVLVKNPQGFMAVLGRNKHFFSD